MHNGQLRVLVLCARDRQPAIEPLAAALRPGLELEVTSEAERLCDLARVQVLYVDSSDAPLTDPQAAGLAAFLDHGGGVVAAGETLSRWTENTTVSGLAGWTPDGRTVDTELVLRDADGERLLGSQLRVRGTVHLLPEVPPGARPLLLTHWRYQEQVVAYARDLAKGRFVYLGLVHRPDAYREPGVQRLVRETLAHVASTGREPAVVGVGLLGFGALGSAHATAIAATAGLELRCVCDHSPERRAGAGSLGVDTVAEAQDLYARPDVHLVLIGTPPVHHAEAALAALDAGKNVVCEKPFALTVADCDRVIARARASARAVTVYQNRRWDPDFVAMRRAIEQGAIGSVFALESFVGGFGHPCHYWHSHEPISGGAIFDWGSHYIDWILELLPEQVAAVSCVAHKRVWHDVTNADHVSVELRFAGGAQASFIHSDIAAALKPKWYVLGTEGAIVGDWQHSTSRVVGPDGEIDEEAVAPTDLPARVRVVRPHPDGGTSEETLALPRRDRLAFYRNVAAHLRSGEPLAVTAEQARRAVAVMETATESAAAGGVLIDTAI